MLQVTPMTTIIANTPEPEINEASCLEDVRRQIDEARAEKRKLEIQIEQIQKENRKRIAALEENFRVIMQLVVGLGEKVELL